MLGASRETSALGEDLRYLSRPDLKSRYDSGEAVPFAATLPEDQQRAVTARKPTREH